MEKNEKNEMKITQKFEKITSDLANELLKKIIYNRSISRFTVEKYSIMMNRGEWNDYSPDSIIISDNMGLLNGQHRLSAMVKSNKSYIYSVWYVKNATKEFMAMLDTGKNRRASDVLSIEDIPNYTVMAALVKRYFNYHTNPTSAPYIILGHRQKRASNLNILDTYNENPDLFQDINKVIKKAKNYTNLFSSTEFGGMMAYLIIDLGYDKEFVYNFFLEVSDVIPNTKPITKVLRSTMVKYTKHATKLEPNQKVILLHKTWNLYVKGKTVSFLKFQVNEKFPILK